MNQKKHFIVLILSLHVQNVIGQLNQYVFENELVKTEARFFKDGRFQITYEQSSKDLSSQKVYLYQEGYWTKINDTIRLDTKGRGRFDTYQAARSLKYYQIQITESYRDEQIGVHFEVENELREPIEFFKISVDRERERKASCFPGIDIKYSEQSEWTGIRSLEYFHVYRTDHVHQEYEKYYLKNPRSNHFRIQAKLITKEEHKKLLYGWVTHYLVEDTKLYEPYYKMTWSKDKRERIIELGGFSKNRYLNRK